MGRVGVPGVNRSSLSHQSVGNTGTHLSHLTWSWTSLPTLGQGDDNTTQGQIFSEAFYRSSTQSPLGLPCQGKRDSKVNNRALLLSYLGMQTLLRESQISSCLKKVTSKAKHQKKAFFTVVSTTLPSTSQCIHLHGTSLFPLEGSGPLSILTPSCFSISLKM